MKINDNISDLYRQRKGTVNILGAGPSLFYVDSRKLEKYDCIYVNSAALIMPKAHDSERWKTWLSVDRLVIRWSYFWESVKENKGCDVKLVKSDFAKYHEHLARANFRYFCCRKEVKIKDIYDNRLYDVSSLPAAIDLALKVGYKKILLFGVDQRFIQGKSHFWEFYPPSKRPKFVGGRNVSLKDQKERFDKNKPCFEELKRIADQMNVEVCNCAKRTSSLNVFPFEEFL